MEESTKLVIQKYLNVIREKVDWEIAAWKGGKTEGGLESQNYVRKLVGEWLFCAYRNRKTGATE